MSNHTFTLVDYLGRTAVTCAHAALEQIVGSGGTSPALPEVGMALMDAMTISAQPVRLDFDDYVSYTEKHPDGSFELIHGVIYELAPEGKPHRLTRHGVYDLLSSLLDSTRFAVWNESSVAAPNWSEGPKPDLFVSRGPRRLNGKYAAEPMTDDVLLMIEISSSTRVKDVERATLYASLSIPEYWMIDLISGIVGVYREPIMAGENGSKYRWFRSYGRNETISSGAIENLTIETNDLLELAQA